MPASSPPCSSSGSLTSSPRVDTAYAAAPTTAPRTRSHTCVFSTLRAVDSLPDQCDIASWLSMARLTCRHSILFAHYGARYNIGIGRKLASSLEQELATPIQDTSYTL